MLWGVSVCVCVFLAWSAVGEFRSDPAEKGFSFACKYSGFSSFGDAAESGSRDTDDHVSHWCGCEEDLLQTDQIFVGYLM